MLVCFLSLIFGVHPVYSGNEQSTGQRCAPWHGCAALAAPSAQPCLGDVVPSTSLLILHRPRQPRKVGGVGWQQDPVAGAPPATEPVSTLCLPWSGFRIQELDILGPEFSGSPLKYNYTPVLDNFTTPLCLTTRWMRSGVGRAQNSPAST